MGVEDLHEIIMERKDKREGFWVGLGKVDRFGRFREKDWWFMQIWREIRRPGSLDVRF